ncbi:MAG: hypothetical protein ACXWRE_04115 [Pseudobdellovibrionaceae bacterium]
MKSTIIVPVSLSLIAAAFGAIANLLYKKAAVRIFEVPLWQNGFLWLGLVLFTLVLVLFITAFRLGGNLMVVYPTYATTYIWALFLASKFSDEVISSWQYLGVGLIGLGVSLIGLGAQR